MRNLVLFMSFMSILVSGFAHAQGTGEFARTTITLPDNRIANAIAYGPGGRLLVLTNDVNSILSIGPQGIDGTEAVINLSGAPALDQVSSATFDSTRGRLLVTNQGIPGSPDSGSILSIDVATGATEVLFSSTEIQSASGIAVRSTGEIFVSNFEFNGAGGVFLIDDPSNSGVFTATEIVGDLDGASGLAFDADNNLIFQNGNDGRPIASGGDGSGNFSGEISRLDVTDTAGGLTFGSTTTSLVGNSTGEIDFIIDSEGDFFTTGTLGLFELERDASGNLTGGETRLLEDLNIDFSSGLAFLPGAVAFDSTQTIAPGTASPILSLVSNSTGEEIISLSLTVTSVPEPTVLPLGFLMVLPLMRRRRQP